MVNDQIDAQFFSMYLFQFSTCFEQPRAHHHQEHQLYQYNLWYMSLCVGDRFVCRSESSLGSFTMNFYSSFKRKKYKFTFFKRAPNFSLGLVSYLLLSSFPTYT